ncbi:uncharacterized protein [Rhodnius prolixus]|uniref:uncharacterized protein n=1 Tax=Rhodnius prolixus TaxID=13249 RepID=UPI003D18F0BF
MKLYLLLITAALTLSTQARRVRVRPVSTDSLEDSPQQVEYYAEQEDDQGPVLVSRQDTYGRATGQPRLQPKLKPVGVRPPPVQTIRNYNKLNDDGSFTFGYEAADGSFKEETRGTDCVVRGKYGYIDPDGNKREFTYVSGNPCDPNSVQEEEEERQEVDSGEENIPPNIPRRPLIPKSKAVVSKPPRPAQTLFHQSYNQDSAEDSEENIPNIPPRPIQPLQHSPRPQPTARPQLVRNYPIPTFAQLEQEVQPQVLRQGAPTSRPNLLLASQPRQSVSITPRPASTQPPATTYRPQLLHLSTPSPTPTASPAYSKRPAVATSAPASLNLDEELKNFQLEHNVVSTPRPAIPSKALTGQPIYTSELVFDPQSGQYNTVLYQQLPQAQADFNLRGRLQPFVQPQQAHFFQPRPFASRPPPPNPYNQQQQIFQQQQSNLLQQSQQLFAAQQKKQQEKQRYPASLLQQEPQRFTSSPKQYAANPLPAQPFFFVTPNGDRTGLSNGQIDAFLRGHSLAL